MKKRLQIILTFCIAVMLLTSVFAGYFPTPEYVVECTCISNSLIGLLFLFSVIRIIRGGMVFWQLALWYRFGYVIICFSDMYGQFVRCLSDEF